MKHKEQYKDLLKDLLEEEIELLEEIREEDREKVLNIYKSIATKRSLKTKLEALAMEEELEAEELNKAIANLTNVEHEILELLKEARKLIYSKRDDGKNQIVDMAQQIAKSLTRQGTPPIRPVNTGGYSKPPQRLKFP
jgi:hypothetical protein